jgi:hypothetical protein
VGRERGCGFPSAAIGTPGFEVSCERGDGLPLLLRPLLDRLALQHGFVSLRAAAFEWEGVAWVVCGDAAVGKTGVLLGFMALGARLIGAESVDVDASGNVHGRPEPVRVRASHLRQFPALRDLVGPVRARQWTQRSLPMRSWTGLPPAVRHAPGSRAVESLLQRAERRTWIDVPAAALGADRRVTTPLPLGRLWIATRGGTRLQITAATRDATLAGLERIAFRSDAPAGRRARGVAARPRGID